MDTATIRVSETKHTKGSQMNTLKAINSKATDIGMYAMLAVLSPIILVVWLFSLTGKRIGER